MDFDKNKVMRAAERFLAQGRISSAIKEYSAIVENDPADVNTQNILGDLYLKSDDKKKAINCYTLVAEYYNSNGYEKKAIAIYNKLHRIEPNSAEISIKLAELYQVRGSNAEAEKHYEQVSNYYEKKGSKVEALTIWEKIAEISPKNTEIYLKIGNFYWQNNQKEEAARAFTEGGLRLAENSQHEEAVAAFSRSFEVAPNDLAALRGYVNSQINLGYTEEAIKTLDELYERDTYNADVVFLLADCYLDMEQPDRAEIIIIELVTREPKAYAKLLHLVDFYMKKNDLDSSVRILSTISEHLLVSQKPERLLDLLNEIVARNPEQLQALRLLTRYYGWHKNDYELKKVLEQLAEAANYNESIDDERFAITQLLLTSPDESRWVNRLGEINESAEPVKSDLAVLVPEEGENLEKVPTFESFEGLLNGNGNGNKDVVEAEIEVKIAPEQAEIELTEDDLNPGYEISETDTEPSLGENELNIDDQIANLEFYVEQGYIDIAVETLSELDDKHGVREEFSEIRKKIEEMNSGIGIPTTDDIAKPIVEIIEEIDEVESVSDEPETTPDDQAAETPIEEQPDVVSGEPTELAEEPVESIEPEVEDIESASSEADVDESSDAHDDELIETVEVDEATAETPAEVTAEAESMETPSEPEPAPPVIEPAKRETVPDPAVSEADEKYETHYHHAVAYQEMGLLEDAIREFQSAIDCVDDTNVSGRFFQCCTLLGHCYIEKSSPAEAIDWFKKAFTIESLGDNETLALNYELAIAYILDENFDDALPLFEKIHSEDAEYRNVEKRIEECKERAGLVPA